MRLKPPSFFPLLQIVLASAACAAATLAHADDKVPVERHQLGHPLPHEGPEPTPEEAKAALADALRIDARILLQNFERAVAVIGHRQAAERRLVVSADLLAQVTVPAGLAVGEGESLALRGRRERVQAHAIQQRPLASFTSPV